jgi:hypothetical protein
MKLPDAAIVEKVRQWLAYADEDLRVARHGFSMPEPPPCRAIAFHAQQCAEKYLKAYLVFHAVDFPYGLCSHNSSGYTECGAGTDLVAAGRRLSSLFL